MRHQNKINQLGRTAPHRKAMLSNMANSLIEHKRISTTVAKAKALRGYVEPLITKSKNDTTHSRRMVFRSLQNKQAVSELFREIAPKVGDRPGGYTRIIKTGFRQGDAAEMCIIELVDFNDMYTTEKKAATKKTRRSRRGSGGAKPKAEAAPAASAEATEAAAAEVVEEVTETPVEETEAAPVEEAKAEEAPAEEAAVEEPAAEEATADELASVEATADEEVKAEAETTEEAPAEPASADAPADEEAKEEAPAEEASADEGTGDDASEEASDDEEKKADS